MGGVDFTLISNSRTTLIILAKWREMGFVKLLELGVEFSSLTIMSTD